MVSIDVTRAVANDGRVTKSLELSEPTAIERELVGLVCDLAVIVRELQREVYEMREQRAEVRS